MAPLAWIFLLVGRSAREVRSKRSSRGSQASVVGRLARWESEARVPSDLRWGRSTSRVIGRAPPTPNWVAQAVQQNARESMTKPQPPGFLPRPTPRAAFANESESSRSAMNESGVGPQIQADPAIATPAPGPVARA